MDDGKPPARHPKKLRSSSKSRKSKSSLRPSMDSLKVQLNSGIGHHRRSIWSHPARDPISFPPIPGWCSNKRELISFEAGLLTQRSIHTDNGKLKFILEPKLENGRIELVTVDQVQYLYWRNASTRIVELSIMLPGGRGNVEFRKVEQSTGRVYLIRFLDGRKVFLWLQGEVNATEEEKLLMRMKFFLGDESDEISPPQRVSSAMSTYMEMIDELNQSLESNNAASDSQEEKTSKTLKLTDIMKREAGTRAVRLRCLQKLKHTLLDPPNNHSAEQASSVAKTLESKCWENSQQNEEQHSYLTLIAQELRKLKKID